MWFERPIGASFGFGGKIVVFKKNQTPAGQPRSSTIRISQFSVDSDVGSASENFEDALKSGDINAICESHLELAKTAEEKADWKVMETLIASNPRQQVIEYLGFSDKEPTNGVGSTQEEGQESSIAPVAHEKSSGEATRIGSLTSSRILATR